MAIVEISQPIQCSDGDNITYNHKVFSNTMIKDIPNLQETEDGCLVSIYRNHLNQYIKIRNSADDDIGWVLIDPLTITGPLEQSDILPQPVIEAVLPNQQPDEAVLPGQQPNGSVLPDQQANEAVLLNENAIAALPRAAIEEALSGQSENEAVLPDEQAIDGVLPDMDDIVLEQDNAGLGLDQPDEVVPHQSNGEELQDPTGNAEELQDPTGNAEGLQDPPANGEVLPFIPLQVQITGFTFRSTDASNSEENLSENPTPEQV